MCDDLGAKITLNLVDRKFLINVKNNYDLVNIPWSNNNKKQMKSFNTITLFLKDPFCPECFTTINRQLIYMHHLENILYILVFLQFLKVKKKLG